MNRTASLRWQCRVAEHVQKVSRTLLTTIVALAVVQPACMSTEVSQLSKTLSTFQAHACSGHLLRLSCPNETVISISFVMVSGHSPLCPNTNYGARSSRPPSNCRPADSATQESLSYALRLKVGEACRGKTQCSVDPAAAVELPLHPSSGTTSTMSSQNHHRSCPRVAEVAFKCSPNTFRNKVACEGAALQLRCPQATGDRIAIMSGFFGSSGTYVPECPLPKPFQSPPGRCEATFVTESLMSKCHGRISCSLDADRTNFELPTNCATDKDAPVTLRATYACVPAKILKVRPTSMDEVVDTTTHDESADFPRHAPDGATLPGDPTPHTDHRVYHHVQDQVRRPGGFATSDKGVSFIPIFGVGPLADHGDNCTHHIQPNVAFRGVVSYVSAYVLVRQHTEKLVLFFLASISASLLVTFILLSGRLFSERRRLRDKKKVDDLDDAMDKSPLAAPFPGVNTEELMADLEAEGLVSSPGVSLLQSHYGSYGHRGHSHGSSGHSHTHTGHGQGGQHPGHHQQQPHYHHHHHVHPITSLQPETVFYGPPDPGLGSMVPLTATLGRSTLRRTTAAGTHLSPNGHHQAVGSRAPPLDHVNCSTLTNESSYF